MDSRLEEIVDRLVPNTRRAVSYRKPGQMTVRVNYKQRELVRQAVAEAVRTLALAQDERTKKRLLGWLE